MPAPTVTAPLASTESGPAPAPAVDHVQHCVNHPQLPLMLRSLRLSFFDASLFGGPC